MNRFKNLFAIHAYSLVSTPQNWEGLDSWIEHEIWNIMSLYRYLYRVLLEAFNFSMRLKSSWLTRPGFFVASRLTHDIEHSKIHFNCALYLPSGALLKIRSREHLQYLVTPSYHFWHFWVDLLFEIYEIIVFFSVSGKTAFTAHDFIKLLHYSINLARSIYRLVFLIKPASLS